MYKDIDKTYGVIGIGNGAFSNIPNLKGVIISNEAFEYISTESFKDNENLETVIITGSQKKLIINTGAFRNCTKLKNLILKNIFMIAYESFKNCNIKFLFLPKTLKEIHSSSFQDCPLTDIFYEGNEDEWNNISGSEAYSNLKIHYNYMFEV